MEESRMLSTERSMIPPLSRKTTRVAVESPRKTSYKHEERTSHLGLTLPVRTAGSRLSRSKLVPFDLEAEYKYDSTDDEDEALILKVKPKPSPKHVTNKAVNVYKKVCRKYGKIPMKNIWRQFGLNIISLKGFNLSQKELKAFFITLLEFYVNTDGNIRLAPGESDELINLILDGNKLGKKPLEYIMDFSAAHRYLTNLSLADCQMSCKNLKVLTEFIERNRTITKLDLSDNKFTDNAGEDIATLIEFSESILELALRGNMFSECGTAIGEALKSNDTLKHLDLCWNHIRGNGAIGLCKGLKTNKGLETLLLAWNGFGLEGSAAMGQALTENTSLETLDLSNNRIHTRDLFDFLQCLDKNKTLLMLKLGHNPITVNMSSVLLTKIQQAKECNIRELDLTGIVVDKEFDGILREIQQSRMLIVRYDKSLPLNKGPAINAEPTKKFEIDPVRILFYMKEHLRTLDLFLKVNRYGSQTMSRDEMKYAFEMEGFPISDSALDKVMLYLEKNKDGDVDFLEMVDGELRLKRELIQDHEDAIMLEKEQDEQYSKVFNAEKTPKILPPLNKRPKTHK